MKLNKLVYISFILFTTSFLFGVVYNYFNFKETSFLQFDALHYLDVKNNGYHDYRVVFFPLLPLMWALTNVNEFGIALINLIVFLSGTWLLLKCFKPELISKELSYFTLLPSGVFFFLPYTESIFFLSSVFILIGIGKQKVPLAILGFFLASLSRPSVTVLIPSLFSLGIFFYNDSKVKKSIIIYILVALLGLMIVVFGQFLLIGEWFAFYKYQSVWDNALRIPTLPLTSWSDKWIIIYDGLALSIGLSSLYFLLKEFYVLIVKRSTNSLSKVEIFSLSYLAIISIIVLMYRGGSLFSLSRFVFTAPFLIFYFKVLNRSIQQLMPWKVLVGFIFYWLLFGSYVHIQTFLTYLGASLFVTLLIMNYLSNKKNWYYQSLRIISILILWGGQLYFMYRYLNGVWIG